jgi:hypothetical protein
LQYLHIVSQQRHTAEYALYSLLFGISIVLNQACILVSSGRACFAAFKKRLPTLLAWFCNIKSLQEREFEIVEFAHMPPGSVARMMIQTMGAVR